MARYVLRVEPIAGRPAPDTAATPARELRETRQRVTRFTPASGDTQFDSRRQGDGQAEQRQSDLSSEIDHALLPAFITVALGLPVTALGAIDGVA